MTGGLFLLEPASSPQEAIALAARNERRLRFEKSPSLGPWIAVMLAATAVVLPFWWLGIPSGHDFEFHLNSWMEVAGQWEHGNLHPTWAAGAHYGYGEPRFIFYPPVSWMLGAALGTLLPWTAVPAAFVWIALTLSGCSMLLLARRWLCRRDAIVAAVLYTANPYFIILVYWRSAFAELLAAALLPLLLMYLLRARDEGLRVIMPLGGVVGAAWLTNVPAAVMLCYSLAILSVVIAIAERFPRVLLLSAGAVLLGACLAAVYLVPAVYEQKWVNIKQVLAPGLSPEVSFLFSTIGDPDHNRFNLLVSLVATAEIAVVALAALPSRSRRQRNLSLWWTTAAWAGLATILMFPVTAFLWRHLPELRFLQFPWRWLLCFNVAFALIVPMAWQRRLPRVCAWLTVFVVLILAWHRVQPPWWELSADIAKMLAAQRTGPGYEGTDEYIPRYADVYDTNLDAALVTSQDGAALPVRILRWDAESKLFVVEDSKPARLRLRLFNYPAWQVTVNGSAVDPETQDNTGQMLIPVPAGINQVRVTFIKTPDRKAGEIISFAMVAVLAGFLLFEKRRRRLTQSI